MKKEIIIDETMDLENIEKEVSFILKRLNIPLRLKGFFLLRDAILICIQDQEACFGITKMLYPTLDKAYGYGVTGSSAERNIRTAIEYAYKYRDDYFYNIFGCRKDVIDSRRPTNGDFISAVADYVKLNE